MARRFEAVIHAANIGLVYKYALHGHAGGDADGQSDASISLLRAIWTFDVQRGYKFSTYATNTIKINSGHVLAELASVRGKAEQYLRANKRPATYRHEPADDDGLNARRARIVRELLDRPDGHDVLGLPAEAMVLLRMRVDEGASNVHMCAVRGLDKHVAAGLLWLAITGMAEYVDGVVGVGVGVGKGGGRGRPPHQDARPTGEVPHAERGGTCGGGDVLVGDEAPLSMWRGVQRARASLVRVGKKGCVV
jgi:hypothetical protein